MVTYNPDHEDFVRQFGADSREIVDRLFPHPENR
jgi:hypothetical protein